MRGSGLTKVVARGAGIVVVVLVALAALGVLGAPGGSGATPAPGGSGPVGRLGALGATPSAGAATLDATPGATGSVGAASVDGRAEPGRPLKVVVGVYLNDIQDIDLENHIYTVDFYVWFRWTDPSINPAESIEFMNGAQQWGTTLVPATAEPEQLPDGSYYFRTHVQSTFKSSLPLADYPFDRQVLDIVMEDTNATTAQLRYVPDRPAVGVSPDLAVPGYRIGTPTMTVANQHYPEMGETGTGPQSASRITVSIPVSHPWLPYTLKIFVPFLLVVLCTAIVFLIDTDHVDARFGLGISALLTLIALKWTTDAQLPLTDYLSLVDMLYLVAFLFVTIGLAETTYTTWMRSRGADHDALERTDRRVFVVASSVFVVGCAIVFLIFLLGD